MKASLHLWRQWSLQVRQLLPAVHGHRTKTLAFFVFGVVLSGKARLPRIAEELRLISPAKTPSIERRLERFLANEQVVVVPIWTTLLNTLLPFFRDRRLLLVLDATPLADRACVVYLGLLAHSRLLPVAWQVMPLHETWEQGQWAIVGTLLDRVISHLGRADCTLIADRGLAGLPLVQLCQARGWHYLVRVSSLHTCAPQRGQHADSWLALAQLVSHPGQSWFGPALLWREHPLLTQLSAVWEPTCKDAWFLISDQPAGRQRVRQYTRRMRVEATFEDYKARGWDIEGTLIADRARLDRLLLVLSLSVWWVSHLAASCIHHGQRDCFDRHDRRDKGIFRLGRLWLRHLLDHTDQVAWCLPFRKTRMGWAFSLRF